MEGTTFKNRYELQAKLGRGGFAVVWRAFDHNLRRDVAVKLLNPRLVAELIEDDPPAAELLAERFRREALAVGRLAHPNIVRIYDADRDGSYLYIVMDLLPNGSLLDKLTARMAQGGPFTLPQVLDLLQPIAAALDHAHAADLIHRDVKPHNVLFDAKDRPVLTDFGLVKIVGESVIASRSASRGILGTPEYIAPEQAQGKPVDARSDVYALAVVAFQLLTGTLPFRGETPLAVMFQAAGTPRETLIDRLPPLDDATRTWLLAGLAIDPADRPATAGAWVAGLRTRQAAVQQAAAHSAAVRAIEKQLAAKQWSAALLAIGRLSAADAAPAQIAALQAQAEAGLRAAVERARPKGPPRIAAWAELRDFAQLPERIIWARDGKEMVLVPAGPFTMGISVAEAQRWSKQYKWLEKWPLAATPAHTVALPAYYIDRTPVTHAEYARFLAAVPDQRVPYVDARWAQPYNWDQKRRTFPDGLANHPVVLVSWHDAQAYARWAGKRLPSEAQWEKAARGSDQRAWPWGDQWDTTRCNNAEQWAGRAFADLVEWNAWWDTYQNRTHERIHTTAVGSYPAGAGPYGTLDQAGNVWEWCSDWFAAYPGSQAQHDRFGEKYLVVRGGAWYGNSSYVRSANRHFSDPGSRSNSIGFRLAQE